jgi:hypothetical protein
MQQQGKEESSMKTSFNALNVLATGWAWCLIPFLRWGMGKNAIGVRGIVAVVIMWAYAAFARCPEVMVQYFCVWLYFVALQRIKTMRLMRQNVVIHSQYAGDPLVMKIFPFIQKVTAAKVTEFILCFFVGISICFLSEGLGGFVIFASFGLAFVAALESQLVDNRRQAMRDAEIDQRFYADLHRGRRKDW